jgi:hypothetical protein
MLELQEAKVAAGGNGLDDAFHNTAGPAAVLLGTAQAEYSTAFLGRTVHGNFQGDVVTDQVDFSQMPKRLPGRRVKHRMKRN